MTKEQPAKEQQQQQPMEVVDDKTTNPPSDDLFCDFIYGGKSYHESVAEMIRRTATYKFIHGRRKSNGSSGGHKKKQKKRFSFRGGGSNKDSEDDDHDELSSISSFHTFHLGLDDHEFVMNNANSTNNPNSNITNRLTSSKPGSILNGTTIETTANDTHQNQEPKTYKNFTFDEDDGDTTNADGGGTALIRETTAKYHGKGAFRMVRGQKSTRGVTSIMNNSNPKNNSSNNNNTKQSGILKQNDDNQNDGGDGSDSFFTTGFHDIESDYNGSKPDNSYNSSSNDETSDDDEANAYDGENHTDDDDDGYEDNQNTGAGAGNYTKQNIRHHKWRQKIIHQYAKTENTQVFYWRCIVKLIILVSGCTMIMGTYLYLKYQDYSNHINSVRTYINNPKENNDADEKTKINGK